MSLNFVKKSARMARLLSAALLFPVVFSGPVLAASDTPFFTGVWELKTDQGLKPLVMSDWLIFDGKLPNTWLYMTKGSVPGQQYRFMARNVGVNGVSAALVDVVRVDDLHMNYRVSAKGAIIEQGEATRLSVPNANDSCLAVDTELKDLMGSWTMVADKKKKVSLSETELNVDGQKQPVELRPIRTGQVGVVSNGAPYALFTDAGGDYAVLQLLPVGTASFAGGPIGQPVNFAQEIVVRRNGGRCDAAIAGRLKLMGKTRK
ncbi:hypothetical protein [uncultured Cohaesibacter sp.]|uniref:hypothetical protein n=1 Tax=uncultured Cohaesibacter sp. TaxID=1002546 RepID=UPI0029C71015|nr:hypothetical protein [uncultured Cohaesibacter sp.]